MNRIPESARKTGVLLAGAGLIACAAVLIFLSIFGSESSETAQDGRSGSTQSAAPDTQKAPDTSDDALTVEKQPPAQPDDRTRISLPPYGTNSPALDINLHPIAGLTPEEQQKANEEANRYVLPVTEYKGEPDIGDGISASGGKRLPSEIQAQVDRNASAVKAVRLNKIGLARLNARRAKQGLPALVAGRDVNVAPIGKDLVVEQSNFREPPKSGGGADSAETEVSGELLTGSETADLPPAGGASGAADNSELQYFPPIRDQGSVDSCVGWSEIYYATTHELAMAYGWDAKNGGDDYRLSPMFTYNFLNEGRDKYTYFTTHFNIARHHGVVRWSEMPNPGDYRKWVTDEDAYLEALKLKTDGYYGYSTIYSMSTTGLDTLKASLDNGHVAAFATFYRGWVFDTVDDDPNTTEDDDVVGLQIAHNLNNTSGGHGMVIVGYNDHLWLDLNNDGEVDANEKGGFKVANSDGTGWKDGGYCYITYDVVRNYSTITGHDGDGLVWQNRVRIAQPRSPQHEPTVVARITLNHTKRNQVKCQLGTSATSSTSPSAITSKIITDTPYEEVYQGGAYAFSGAAAASEDFTYYLDFTDELPSAGTPRRYYVIGTDRGTNDGNLTIKEFELYSLVDGAYRLIGTATNTPAVANGATQNVWIDWTPGQVQPAISLTAGDDAAAEEGQDPGVWTITRDGDTTDPLPVYFTLSGSADPESDYTVDHSGSVSIPAGQVSVTVTLTPVDDAVYSEFESAEMTLSADAAYLIATPDPVAISITDNDNHAPAVDAGTNRTVYLVGGTLWTPAELSPAGWYDAGDASTLTADGGTVSQWRDKSGNELHLQSSGTQQPLAVTNTINGMPAIDFDGSDDQMGTSTNPFSPTIEDAFVIAVHQVDNNANQQGSLFNLSGIGGNTGRWQAHAPYKGTLYFDTANISAGRVNTGYGVSAEDNVLVSFYGSTSDNVQQVYKNGSYLVGDASGHSTTAAGNIYIGCNAGSAYQDTSIGEIILINGTVGTEDRQKLEGCLAHKWGLENALPADHPYKTAAPGGAGVSLELNGTVTDEDGTLPAATWTKEAGPGTVTFNDASAVDTTVTISEAGTYILRLTADDGLNQTVDEISITVHDAASAGYAQWAADWTTDIGATTNDFDADGLNNFGEYALGGNPTNALDHGTPPAFTQSGSGFVYVYPMRSDDETITYLVETTTNLISGVWTNQGGTAIGTNITGGDINFVTNNVGTIEKAKFIRLNIER